MKKEVIASIFIISLLAILLILPSISALDLQEQGDAAKADLDKTTDYAKSSFNFNSDIQLPDYIEKTARILFHLDNEEISLSALVILVVLFIWVLVFSFNLFEISFTKNYAFLLALILAITLSYLGILGKLTLVINWLLTKLPIFGEGTTFALLIRIFYIICIVIGIIILNFILNEYLIDPIKNWLEIRKVAKEGKNTGETKRAINSTIKAAKEIQEGYEEEGTIV